jgi:hypothetical protein
VCENWLNHDRVVMAAQTCWLAHPAAGPSHGSRTERYSLLCLCYEEVCKCSRKRRHCRAKIDSSTNHGRMD